VFEAAAVCRWLGEHERLPEVDQCFPPIPKIREYQAEGRMPLDPGYLRRPGYRLPTEAEWEFSCRAGSLVGRPYGRTGGLLTRYAWSIPNAGRQVCRAGTLKPNDLGLFDVLGNLWEWCLDDGKSYRPNFGGLPAVDNEELDAVSERVRLILRGGAYNSPEAYTRSSSRIGYSPDNQLSSLGFRVARTLPWRGNARPESGEASARNYP
jgi:formylglycine-generating enzyme required for sulfatase activity